MDVAGRIWSVVRRAVLGASGAGDRIAAIATHSGGDNVAATLATIARTLPTTTVQSAVLGSVEIARSAHIERPTPGARRVLDWRCSRVERVLLRWRDAAKGISE